MKGLMAGFTFYEHLMQNDHNLLLSLQWIGSESERDVMWPTSMLLTRHKDKGEKEFSKENNVIYFHVLSILWAVQYVTMLYCTSESFQDSYCNL